MTCNPLLKVLFLAMFLLYLPYQSFGWGMLGHRIIGEIAASYLTPKARKAVQQILGAESIAMASNWADFIKADPSYKYLSDWHYVNFDTGLSYSEMQDQLKSDTSANAYTKLNFLMRQLKNKSLPQKEKLMNLRMLIHVAGDVHQPFHTGRAGDSGGNGIKVSWLGNSSNIHRLWDDQLIDFQKLSYTEYASAINHPNATQRALWQKQPVSKWLFDSYVISGQLYRELEQPDQKLGLKYNFEHLNTLNEQLLKGGVHLAALLNQIFT